MIVLGIDYRHAPEHRFLAAAETGAECRPIFDVDRQLYMTRWESTRPDTP